MSAQTGSIPPPGPASTRFVDQARFRVERLRAEPNPLWIRELRQSARLGRTPVVLTVLSVLMTLLIAAIGGIVSTEQSPATTGVILFQVFFSLAYFVVTLIGPAVAANSIASEREGRTWEAVILTGLSPGVIARGKFLAAFTSVAMYIVMLAPVGALPFLFGGVTATEVVVAFAGLFLISLLSIAFGLAISSKMSSLRAAIVVTLLLAIPITTTTFTSFGWGLSYAAHRAWPGVAEGPPIWLPTAYERAPFDASYVLFLVVLPVLSVVLPAWFLYEVTVANLTSVTDDRTSGLKRWFLLAAPSLTVAAAVPILTVPVGDALNAALLDVTALFFFFVFCVFLFAADPIGPSRRVVTHWDRAGKGRVRRFLGPGVARSGALLLVAGTVALAAVTAVGVRRLGWVSGTGSADVEALASFSAYGVGFYVFVVGLAAFLRSRASSPLVARVLLLAILFAVSVAPWLVAAIAGLIAEHASKEAILLGAPSPFYVIAMVAAAGSRDGTSTMALGMLAAGLWSLVGLLLLTSAGARCRSIIRRHEAMLAESDRMLAAEDAAAEAAQAAKDAPPEEPAVS